MNRNDQNSARRRRGLAAMEVVLITAAIIPALFALLFLGYRTMAAFLSLLGTMIGSPFM